MKEKTEKKVQAKTISETKGKKRINENVKVQDNENDTTIISKRIEEETMQRLEDGKLDNSNNSARGSYLFGIIGALIGGIIGSIPWILVYVYGNMMFSALAIFIAAGEFLGYKLCRGKIDKKLPLIIMILAVIVVSIATLLVIPTILIKNEGVEVTIETLKNVYSNRQFASAIIRDYAISVVFTILGASIIATTIKKQIDDGKTESNIKLDLANQEEIEKAKKIAIENIKPIFLRFNAISKEHGILKDELIAEINDIENGKRQLKILEENGIVKKSSGRYYYIEKNESNNAKIKKNSKIVLIVLITTFAIMAILAAVLQMKGEKLSIDEKNEISDSDISFEISKTWTQYTSSYSSGWNFYKYINSVQNSETMNSTTTLSSNYKTSYPANINVASLSVDISKIANIKDVESNIKTYIYSGEDDPSEYNAEFIKSKNGYDTLKIKIVYSTEPEEVEYCYYILNGEKLISIELSSYNVSDLDEIEKTGLDIVNTLKFN